MRLRRACVALLMAMTGCHAVPPDLAPHMVPPDGERPNNFGRLVEGTEKSVVPDRPTIAAVRTAVHTGARR